MESLKTLKMVALDIDGVALKDTFSPIIYSLTMKWGHKYTAEIERNVFSQPQKKAARYLIDAFGLSYDEKELLDIYFAERKKFLETNDGGIVEGLEDFLKLCKNLNLPIICYGGLEKDHFNEKLGRLTSYFDGEKYICTNDFRPGIKEIVTKYYTYNYSEVLFIDDVNKVAEEAKALNVPFIGVPSDFEFGFQRQGMIETGVKYMVKSVKDISLSLLNEVDEKSREKSLW